MPDSVDDNYKPIFEYNGVNYSELSDDLVKNIYCGPCNGSFLLNLDIQLARSQLLYFKETNNDPRSWETEYLCVQNEFLRN